MGTCCETICKHRILFPSIQHLAWLPQGRPQGKQKCGKNSRNINLRRYFKFNREANCNTSIQTFICPMCTATLCNLCYIDSLLWTSCLRFLTKSPAIPRQLYKTASRSLSAIAELLVLFHLQVVALTLITVAGYTKALTYLTVLPAVSAGFACGVFLLFISIVGLFGITQHNQAILFFVSFDAVLFIQN